MNADKDRCHRVEALFLLLPIPQQEPAIEAHCFGDCGKIVSAGVNIDVDGYSVCGFPCKESRCGYEMQRADVGVGTLAGKQKHVFVRRLKE